MQFRNLIQLNKIVCNQYNFKMCLQYEKVLKLTADAKFGKYCHFWVSMIKITANSNECFKPIRNEFTLYLYRLCAPRTKVMHFYSLVFEFQSEAI